MRVYLQSARPSSTLANCGQSTALATSRADIKGNDCSPRMAMHKAVAVISVITRAEIRYGQALMAANDKRHQRINLLIEQLPALPWTDAAADCYASIRATLKPQGLPVGELYTQIAAHALAEKLVLVNHNTRHFENVRGLKIEDRTVRKWLTRHKKAIQTALHAFTGKPLDEAAMALFACLCYASHRAVAVDSIEKFCTQFDPDGFENLLR
jgi:tRNA(fMet)-specific endonuclease VapC